MTHQLDQVKQELILEKKKNRVMVKTGQGEGGGGVSGGEGGGQLATMEMQVLNEKQRTELANAR